MINQFRCNFNVVMLLIMILFGVIGYAIFASYTYQPGIGKTVVSDYSEPQYRETVYHTFVVIEDNVEGNGLIVVSIRVDNTLSDLYPCVNTVLDDNGQTCEIDPASIEEFLTNVNLEGVYNVR